MLGNIAGSAATLWDRGLEFLMFLLLLLMIRCRGDGRTELITAAQSGKSERIRTLLKRGAGKKFDLCDIE